MLMYIQSYIIFRAPQSNKGMLFSLLSDTKLILSLYVLPLVVFLRPFDEGLPSGQSRVAIDPLRLFERRRNCSKVCYIVIFLIMDSKLILSLYIQPLVVFLCHVNKGPFVGQFKAVIDLSGAQNDRENVGEVDQEGEKTLIYPSILMADLNGESDAEGIVTT
jgi:hypothetical protein